LTISGQVVVWIVRPTPRLNPYSVSVACPFGSGFSTGAAADGAFGGTLDVSECKE
jgi:hypothetical protein